MKRMTKIDALVMFEREVIPFVEGDKQALKDAWVDMTASLMKKELITPHQFIYWKNPIG